MKLHELFSLEGKTAVVTGGSRGLGLEMARAMGEAGARIVITARRAKWLDSAAATLQSEGFSCLAIESDVSRPGDVDAVVEQTLDRFGSLDILVNNAGLAWGAPAESMELEKWKAVLDVNLTGAFLMAQRAGRQMIKSGGGKIINIASIAGLVGGRPEILDAVAYSASKSGLIGLTRDLAVKWARYNILVNAIAPGFFPTRMTKHVLAHAQPVIEKAIPLGRLGQPSELKGAIVFLASPASDYITGQVLPVDGGSSCL